MAKERSSVQPARIAKDVPGDIRNYRTNPWTLRTTTFPYWQNSHSFRWHRGFSNSYENDVAPYVGNVAAKISMYNFNTGNYDWATGTVYS